MNSSSAAAPTRNFTNCDLVVNARPEKILALQFKYFGDAVLMTPALRALREHFPSAEIHLLVPAEIAPLFQHNPRLTRVWAMPRKRGRASVSETLPLIRALRRERFDRSVDFASNDRGAILSRLIGAKSRLGWDEDGGFFARRLCYNARTRIDKNNLPHETTRLVQLLSAWKIPPPSSLEAEIHSNPALAEAAKKILPGQNVLLCHVASSQKKKEWPLTHWAEFYRLATAAGHTLVFTTARGEREAALIKELKTLLPSATILPAISELDLFLAVLARAKIFISGDTGPLHFAAGLGVPTISLFGPSQPARWAPVGAKHVALVGSTCRCDGNFSECKSADHCLAQITPSAVFAALQK